MVETPRIRVAGQYVSLVDQGVPLSVCLHLQQLGLQLQQAQWTARHSLGGWIFHLLLLASPGEESANQESEKGEEKRVKVKSTAPLQVSNRGPVSHLHISGSDDSRKLELEAPDLAKRLSTP